MKRRTPERCRRRGTILVLSALVLIALVSMVAFAVDIGYLFTVKTDLQKAADAAALAAAAELVDDEALGGTPDLTDEVASARGYAATYAAYNPVCQTSPTVDSVGDVVVGNLTDFSDRNAPLTFTDPLSYNAVQVTVRRNSVRNGNAPLFFGRIFGATGAGLESTAVAALMNSFLGFQAPSDGGNLDILPFALDKDTWDDLLAGGGNDDFRYVSGAVSAGTDGVREVNLYPQSTGSPGNRGTVDIGGSNNSTCDIARQILDGISPQDLVDLGKPLALDDAGHLALNGDTGISAGVKDELAAIKGQPRIIPIFDTVTSPGNNAQYRIVQFAGIRIMDVRLTGSHCSKRVIIQPAEVTVRGGIPNSGGQTSYYMHSGVWLVR